MSTEETRESTYNIEKRLSDDKVSLVKMPDGSHIVELKAVDKWDVGNRCLWLERAKESSKDDESRHLDLLPPSTYNIIPTDSTIKITGDEDELEDAARTLHHCHNYISALKMQQLVGEISDIRVKEIKTREHQARQEKRKTLQATKEKEKEMRIRKKYTRLATKLGMDPNIIFPNPSTTSAEKNSPPLPPPAEIMSSSTSTITKTK